MENLAQLNRNYQVIETFGTIKPHLPSDGNFGTIKPQLPSDGNFWHNKTAITKFSPVTLRHFYIITK